MMLRSWINRLKKGDTFAAIHASDWNKIANVLETIKGEDGIEIVKTDSGVGWTIHYNPSENPQESNPGGEGGGEDDPDTPPNCGNPLNGGGGGATDNPLDVDSGYDGTDSIIGGHNPDDNPLDHPGEGGYTPESSGPGDDPSSQDC